MRLFNRYAYILLIGIIFLLILYKVIHIPILKDEWETPVKYIDQSVWEIMMYTTNSPNNHILNTLLVKLFVFLFGTKEQLILRLPNLLSFIIYGIAIYRINKIVLTENSVFFLPASIFFVSNPYLLDFFGLCRGYGISCALATLSISYLIYGYYNSKSKSVWIAYGISILASYANFTLLVFWLTVSFMVWFYSFKQSKRQFRQIIQPTLIIGIITILYVALIANPIIKMYSTNEFRFWTSKGFYWDTIYPLIEYSRSGSHMILGKSHLIAILVFLIIIVNCIYVFKQFKKSNYNISDLNQPAFVTTAVLLITAFVNIAQCKILNTPNLHGRTALFFYPLFITAFASFLGIIPAVKARIAQFIIASSLAFIGIFHIADGYKLNWVRDNWFDVNTFGVINYLNDQCQKKPVSLKTSWLFYHSFDYYRYIDKIPWIDLKDYDESIDLNTNADYYYILAEDYKKLESQYEVVYKPDPERWLLRKKNR